MPPTTKYLKPETIRENIHRCELRGYSHQMYLTVKQIKELSTTFDVVYEPLNAFNKPSSIVGEGARQKKLHSIREKRHESCKDKCQLEKIGGTCKGLPCARMKP